MIAVNFKKKFGVETDLHEIFEILTRAEKEKNLKEKRKTDSEGFIYFMNSPYGGWIYDADAEDISNAITLISKGFHDTRKPDAIKLLNKILSAKYFKGNDKKLYRVVEEPKKFFIEYIPRIYKFEAQSQLLGPITPENVDEFKVFTKIKDLIESVFDIHFSMIPLPKSDIYELPYSNLIGSRDAIKNRYLVQASIDDLLKLDYNNYFLMGFWGHGVNSYAFYYLRADSKSNIFLRLPYGGAYMDNDKEKVCIKNYLTRFFSLEMKLSPISDHILALETMGASNFEVKLKNGKKFNYRHSFYYSEEKYKEFSEMISKLL